MTTRPTIPGQNVRAALIANGSIRPAAPRQPHFTSFSEYEPTLRLDAIGKRQALREQSRGTWAGYDHALVDALEGAERR